MAASFVIPNECEESRFMLRISQTLAEKVYFRQVGHIGATRERVLRSCAIVGQIRRRGFSAGVQLMLLLFEQILNFVILTGILI